VSDEAPEPFDVKQVGGVTVVTLAGPKFPYDAREALYGLAADPGARRLVLDLSAVRILTSAPLAALVSLQMKVEAAGGVLKLCGIDPDIRDLLRLTRVEQRFSVYRDVQEALKAFQAE